jgi:hypothetical protein
MAERLEEKIIFLLVLFLFLLPAFSYAQSEGQQDSFFVDESYDLMSRNQIKATLITISEQAYFYIDNDWYRVLSLEEQENVEDKIASLSKSFDEKIYSRLHFFYDEEWSPGVDNDKRITILFHQMKESAAGYFNSGDEYPKIQNKTSNEREMVYLNTGIIFSSVAPSYLAHEFSHLINFNQKERLRGVTEEVWLNELRAELAPTLLGYDKEYQNSNLLQRKNQFIAHPSNSLTEWLGEKGDYGVINIFGQYLVEQYGSEILKSSLNSSQSGIDSINTFLRDNNRDRGFAEIFTDWTITVFLNNCEVNEAYCYQEENLKNLKINPSLIFLPSAEKTEASLNYSIKQWSGNWYRIIGGEGDLAINFDGEDLLDFEVAYLLCKDNNDCQVNFLDLNNNQEGTIEIDNFKEQWDSLTLIPSIQSKTSGFNGSEDSYNFSLVISAEEKEPEEEEDEEDEALIEQLKARIVELEARIAEVKAKIAAILGETNGSQYFGENLYYGLNNSNVRRLQEFLKNQGEDIYPQGLVTGYFGPLTHLAVIRFQEKYSDEILAPLGLEQGTGFVGQATRKKINELISEK